VLSPVRSEALLKVYVRLVQALLTVSAVVVSRPAPS
jgi:hypothetical protein